MLAAVKGIVQGNTCLLYTSNDEMKRKGEALGADAQLSKPEIANLVRIIDDLVKK